MIMAANETQVGGDHYKDKAIQPWDYISSNNMGYLAGCIVKYVSRYEDKNGLEDLEKAKHFLEKLIEVEQSRTPTIGRAELLKELLPGVQELFGMEYAKSPITSQEELNKLEKKAYRAAKKFVAEQPKKRGRPRKAPYGYKANGKPYLRKPRNWKESE
jgi:hypothetical protein